MQGAVPKAQYVEIFTNFVSSGRKITTQKLFSLPKLARAAGVASMYFITAQPTFCVKCGNTHPLASPCLSGTFPFQTPISLLTDKPNQPVHQVSGTGRVVEEAGTGLVRHIAAGKVVEKLLTEEPGKVDSQARSGLAKAPDYGWVCPLCCHGVNPALNRCPCHA